MCYAHERTLFLACCNAKATVYLTILVQQERGVSAGTGHGETEVEILMNSY